MSPFENMSTLNVVVGIIFILLTLLLLIPGAMASLGNLPGNKWFGLHVPAVRKDRAIWDQAHRVAGPFWVLAAVALAFGAAFSFIASGWMWVLPAVALVAAVVAASLGGKEPNEIEILWPGLSPPYTELFAWLEGRAEKPETRDLAPFRPAMLAHAIEETDFAALNPQDFTAEWKWDGIRVQAVAGRDDRGRGCRHDGGRP